MELIEKISEITWLVTILKAVLLLAFTYLAVLVIDRTFTKIGRNENLNLKFLNSFLEKAWPGLSVCFRWWHWCRECPALPRHCWQVPESQQWC